VTALPRAADAASSRSYLLKSLAAIGLLQLAIMLVQLARTKGLALLLGPELVGVMAVIDKLLAVIAQTASLSLPFAAVRFLPSLWESSATAFLAVLRRMRALLLVLVLFAAAGGAAVTLLAPAWWGAELLPYRNVVLAAFATLPVVAIVPFVQNAIAGRLEQSRSMLFALAHAIVFASAALLGVWWRGLFGLYVVYAVAGAVLVLAGARHVARPAARPAPGAPPPVPADPAGDESVGPLGLPRQMWAFSLALLGLTFLTPYAALFVHYRVLRLYGADAAGWMQAAVGISLSVRALLGAAHAVMLTPNLNRRGTPASRLEWANEFQRTLCLISALAVPPLLLFPEVAVRLLYAASFMPGAHFVALFVIGEVIGLIAAVYQGILVAHDHVTALVAQNVAAQLVLLAVAAVFVERHGIAAAAAAGITAQLFLYGATALFLRRRYALRLPRRDVALAGYVVVALALAGAAGVTAGTSGSAVAAKASLYAATAALLVPLLTPGERRGLLRFVRGAPAHLAGHRLTRRTRRPATDHRP
jgi:enterobacterial common antigen flippase